MSSWKKAPNQFTREQSQEWHRWMADDNGTTPNRDAGSRTRPKSVGPGDASVDELYDLMVKRGLVAKEG